MNAPATCTILLLAALLLIAGSVSSNPMPVMFYGNVMLDGKPAPAGTVITARTHAEDCGSWIVDQPGTYGQAPGSNVTSFVVDCPSIRQNDRIHFFLNGIPATETFDYRQPGSPVNLLLTADGQALPEVNFTVSGTEGTAPFVAGFTDTSGFAATSFSWDFGDGSSPSFARNPIHTYTRPGVYDVHHIAATSSMLGTADRPGIITVYPRGDFNHDWKIDADDVAYLGKMERGEVAPDPNADLNHDGVFNESDIATLLYFSTGK